MVVHILNKDISYDSKLNESTNKSFWGKIFKLRAKMFKIHNTVQLAYNEHRYCEFTFITKFFYFPGKKCA